MRYLVNIVDNDTGWMLTVADDHSLSRAIDTAKRWRLSWAKDNDRIEVLEQTPQGYRVAVTITKKETPDEPEQGARTGRKKGK